MYGYPTGLDVPPVSLVRGGREDVLERRRHIHDFPALWYAATDGLVYVAAAGEVLDPAQMADREDGVGVFFVAPDAPFRNGSANAGWPRHAACSSRRNCPSAR
jgi:AraC family transcriptional regulator, transcriptional activator of pobA